MAIPRGTTTVQNDLLNTLCEIVLTATEDLDISDSILLELSEKNVTEPEVDTALEFARSNKFKRT